MVEHEHARPELGCPGSGCPFSIRDRVRWSDVDAAGIICYGAFLRFFELAETELFRAAGFPPAALSDKLWLVRRRVECDFHSPVRLDEELDVGACVAAVRTTSIQIGFVAVRASDAVLVAESRYILVGVDRAGLRPTPLPPDLRAGLAAYRCDRTSGGSYWIGGRPMS